MARLISTLGVIILFVAVSIATAGPATADSLKDPKAQSSYTIGFNIGSQMKGDAIAVDPDVLARGVRDALASATPAISLDQMRAAMTSLQASVIAHRQQVAAQLADNNKTQGAAFLKANAAKPGVVTLPSGLQYEILVKGTGAKPKPTDTVVCNYRGTLTDGKEFDASDKHGGPASFPVTGVIKGWTEALQLMPVGSKWRLVLPSELAYGEKGAGGDIGPDAVLVFEVELVSIKAGS